MSILNRHLLYHSNEKKFKCGTCSASFISSRSIIENVYRKELKKIAKDCCVIGSFFCIPDNQLNRHSLKHTNQRNVMCPYCQKRFKSKATCRIHLQIHKTEWVKQFKEQLKSGTIQFEEETPPHDTNVQVHTVMDVMTSTSNEGILQTLNETNNETVENIQENSQVLFTNLIQETQIDDSRNQFEYFLLLPTTNSDTINDEIGVDVRSESEQFIVNDEQLSFANLQFIQLDQSSLLEIQNGSQTITQTTNYRLHDNQSIEGQLSQVDLQSMDSNGDCESNTTILPAPVCDSNETVVNVTSKESNQIASPNKKLTNPRTRKSPKSINKCETCSKIFQKPIDLRRHIRTHTLEKVIFKFTLQISTN